MKPSRREHLSMNTQRKPRILSALIRAAGHKSLSAAFILARLYDEGWGVQKDIRRAVQWYRRAATGGLPEAYYFLGTAYRYGFGVRQDDRQAFHWFRASDRSGDLDGAYMAAICVLEGSGTRRDETKGIRLLQSTALRGSASAMDSLAAHYLSRGALSKARRWASRACRAGAELGRMRLREINLAAQSAQ